MAMGRRRWCPKGGHRAGADRRAFVGGPPSLHARLEEALARVAPGDASRGARMGASARACRARRETTRERERYATTSAAALPLPGDQAPSGESAGFEAARRGGDRRDRRLEPRRKHARERL